MGFGQRPEQLRQCTCGCSLPVPSGKEGTQEAQLSLPVCLCPPRSYCWGLAYRPSSRIRGLGDPQEQEARAPPPGAARVQGGTFLPPQLLCWRNKHKASPTPAPGSKSHCLPCDCPKTLWKALVSCCSSHGRSLFIRL